MEPIIIDWAKLTKQTGDEDLDIRLAHIVLNKLGIKWNNINAYIEDSKKGGWKLAIN